MHSHKHDSSMSLDLVYVAINMHPNRVTLVIFRCAADLTRDVLSVEGCMRLDSHKWSISYTGMNDLLLLHIPRNVELAPKVAGRIARIINNY